MERYYSILKEQLKHNTFWQVLICAAMLLLSPLVLGIRNLDQIQSAKVLEMYVALIGIVLLTPIFQPEQNPDVRDLIHSKYTKITTIYGIRAVIGIVISMICVFLYMEVMKAGNCEMEVGKYYFGVMAEVLAFGGFGILAYALGDNLVIGYMAPMVYYIAAYGAGVKHLKKFYPFGMLIDYETKYVLFITGIVCIVLGIVIKNRRD